MQLSEGTSVYEIDIESPGTSRCGYGFGSLAGCSGTTPAVEVTETIGVSDSPQMSTAVLVRVEESIGIVDSPQLRLSSMLTVVEPITVTDSVRIQLPVAIRIVETIGVTDTPTIHPTQRPTLPVINYFTAKPTQIGRGASSTLSWSVTGATTIVIDNKIGSVQSIGTRVVYPLLTTTYTLTATNAAGSIKASVTVTVLLLR